LTSPCAKPWFVEAFGGDYLERYAHRSPEAAACEAPFLLRELHAAPGAAVLDLCCGAGRHSAALAAAGLRVTGVDLSLDLLRRASSEAPGPRYVRADMRLLPFAPDSFGGAVNLFTSFGYFGTDAENLAALREAARVLKPGAALLLDFFNLAPTLERLVPHSERHAGGRRIVETRRYDAVARRLEKSVRIEAPDAGPREMLESVRAYAPEEFEGFFTAAGLEIRGRFGDMQGSAFDAAVSPRCINVGIKR